MLINEHMVLLGYLQTPTRLPQYETHAIWESVAKLCIGLSGTRERHCPTRPALTETGTIGDAPSVCMCACVAKS